jgi:hypothetical protein
MRTAFILAITVAVCMCSGGVSGTAKLGEGGENKPSSFCAEGEGTLKPEHQTQVDDQDYNEFMERFDKDPWGELRRMEEIFKKERSAFNLLRQGLEQEGPVTSKEKEELFKLLFCKILGLGARVSEHVVRRARGKVVRSQQSQSVAQCISSLSAPQQAQFRQFFDIMGDA